MAETKTRVAHPLGRLKLPQKGVVFSGKRYADSSVNLLFNKLRSRTPPFHGMLVAEAESSFGEAKVEHVGATVLDRIHQSMILFAAGRGEALKRFLIEDGAGQDQRFWRLAQALSALYPSHTEEKRWVDGVLARKKGLGF